MKIRKLGANDARIWRQIRLEGLAAFPDAFLTQTSDVTALSIADLQRQVQSSATFVAFDGDEPVASMVCLVDTQKAAVAHRATIVAVYVRAEYQGEGVAEKLLLAVLDDLPECVLQVHLEVAATNLRGIAFYKKHGFHIVGTIPRAVLLNGIATDDHIMVRMLDT